MENKSDVTETQVTPIETSTQPAPAAKIPKNLIILVVMVVILSLSATLYILFKPSSQPEVLPSPLVKQPLTLDLLSPADGELAVNREVLVSGKTLPNTPVVVYTETDETSVDSDATGMFTTTVSLDDGINTLVVTAYGENGEEQTKSVDIVYDPES